jgi:tetratricopeptide (TPR) repeat protein
MSPPAPLLDRARQSHQAGNFRQAEQLCQQFLNAQSGNPAAWSLLATACQAQGKLPEAVAGYRRALDLQPQSLGTLMALAAQGQRDDAVTVYRQALRRIVPKKADFFLHTSSNPPTFHTVPQHSQLSWRE